MKSRWVFPIFNAGIGLILGGVSGYYIFNPLQGLWIGGLVGLALGTIIELLLGWRGVSGWLYRRRVLLAALFELPVCIFVVAPYLYVILETRPDPHPICCETPLDYGASTYETVSLPVAPGIVLSGWYVPPRRSGGTVIVVLPGAHEDRRGSAWHARQFIQAGYGVFLYDPRALGESTGQVTCLGWEEGADLLQVIAALEKRPEVAAGHIGVVGLSGGAHAALNAAYLAQERLPALWLDGVQAQGIEDFPAAQNAGEQFATAMNLLVLRMTEFHLGRSAPPPFIEILPAISRPAVMMVYAGQDDFERRVGEKYAGRVGANVQIWPLPQAWHVGGPQRMPDEYSRRMLAFFDSVIEP